MIVGEETREEVVVMFVYCISATILYTVNDTNIHSIHEQDVSNHL